MTKILVLALTIAAACGTAGAQAAAKPTTSHSPELALQYTYLRSNTPVGQCGCFSPQGGSATFAVPVGGSHIAVVGDVAVVHGGGSGYGLTLSAFTAGVRCRPGRAFGFIQPFGQVMTGGAHASGLLVSGNTPAASEPALVFAANVGGGLDLSPHHSRHFAYRLVEAAYVVTRFQNGVNDHQNILRLSTGIVLRFGGR